MTLTLAHRKFYRNRLGDVHVVETLRPQYAKYVKLSHPSGRRIPYAVAETDLLFKDEGWGFYHANGGSGITLDQQTPFDLITEISEAEAYSEDPYPGIDVDWYCKDQFQDLTHTPFFPTWSLPHGFREMNLMVAGVKPFGIVGDPPGMEAFIKEHNLCYEKRFHDRGNVTLLVSRPEEIWRISAYKALLRKGVFSSADVHRVTGGLFGYRLEDVERYIARPNVVKQWYHDHPQEENVL